MGSGNLRESRIAEKVDRRLDTWSGDMLIADVESPLADERYDILVVDFKNNSLAADIVSRPMSRLNEVLHHFCVTQEERWSYELNHSSNLDDVPKYQKLEANILYEGRDNLERLDKFQAELFGENFRTDKYELMNMEEVLG